jgi:hypothetical protein
MIEVMSCVNWYRKFNCDYQKHKSNWEGHIIEDLLEIIIKDFILKYTIYYIIYFIVLFHWSSKSN